MSHSDSNAAQQPTPAFNASGRWATVAMAALMALAAIGYFVGLTDGAPHARGVTVEPLLAATTAHPQSDAQLMEAVSYAEIASKLIGPTEAWQKTAKPLPEAPSRDLFAEVVVDEAAKQRSNEIRGSRRAFNGAPPVISHAVQDTNDAACYACHSQGVQLAGMKASVMSHAYLANCTQCHAPPPPQPFKAIDATVATSFVGLPAPKRGKRAYPGAPPTIPHSQWMRENCDACHGGLAGWDGLQSTHPWRTNCTQCHAPSSAMDQAFSAEVIPMLPPPRIPIGL